jgi:gamma-glutamyl-gamma-aminobutyrate hydrolase PuuD
MGNDDRRILVTNRMIEYGKPLEEYGTLNCSYNNFKLHPENYKLVLFTGGEDVDPSFYNDTSPKGICHYDTERDLQESAIYKIAVENNIKMVGVCRGMQLLTVLTGGSLIHHATGHGCGMHDIVITINGRTRKQAVNSLHHQLCIPSRGNYVIGWSAERLSEMYVGKDDKRVNYTGPEIEAIVFPDINAFGVQYHPEMLPSYSPGCWYFKQAVKDLLDMKMETFLEKYRGVKDVSARI